MSAENQWSRMLQHPGCKLSSTGMNHSSAMLFLSIHTHDTELTTQCFTPWEYWVSKQTFQRVSNGMIETSYHYKLSNKHVIEVSTAVWNCLIELEWLEDSVCLHWSLRTRIVITYITTEQEPVQKQGGTRGNLTCGQEVLVDSCCQIWLSNSNNTRM